MDMSVSTVAARLRLMTDSELRDVVRSVQALAAAQDWDDPSEALVLLADMAVVPDGRRTEHTLVVRVTVDIDVRLTTTQDPDDIGDDLSDHVLEQVDATFGHALGRAVRSFRVPDDSAATIDAEYPSVTVDLM